MSTPSKMIGRHYFHLSPGVLFGRVGDTIPTPDNVHDDLVKAAEAGPGTYVKLDVLEDGTSRIDGTVDPQAVKGAIFLNQVINNQKQEDDFKDDQIEGIASSAECVYALATATATATPRLKVVIRETQWEGVKPDIIAAAIRHGLDIGDVAGALAVFNDVADWKARELFIDTDPESFGRLVTEVVMNYAAGTTPIDQVFPDIPKVWGTPAMVRALVTIAGTPEYAEKASNLGKTIVARNMDGGTGMDQTTRRELAEHLDSVGDTASRAILYPDGANDEERLAAAIAMVSTNVSRNDQLIGLLNKAEMRKVFKAIDPYAIYAARTRIGPHTLIRALWSHAKVVGAADAETASIAIDTDRTMIEETVGFAPPEAFTENVITEFVESCDGKFGSVRRCIPDKAILDNIEAILEVAYGEGANSVSDY